MAVEVAGVRRIMIVGNGAQPEGAAALIDGADLVIRFNDCRSFGIGGTRTDIVVVCNTGRPGKAMSGSADWRESAPIRAAKAIWSVRDPGKFSEMKPGLAKSHPELDDFCDDYTDDFAAVAMAEGKMHFVIPRVSHEGLDLTLAAYAPGDYVVPSTGAVTIAHLLGDKAFSGAEIALTGFTHQGWEWHPFAAERRWIDELVALGRMCRIDSRFSATNQGKANFPHFSELTR